MPRVRLLMTETRPAAQPPLCLICGRPAECHITKQFTWRPEWLTYSLWPSVFCCQPAALVILIIGFAQTRRAGVETPLCSGHRHYWNWRGFWLYVPLLGLLAFAVAIAVLFLLERLEDDLFGWLFLAAIVALIGWVVFALVLSRSTVRAVEITDTDITLEPVSAEYVAALRRERSEKRQTPVLAWDDYDPYPRA